MKHPNVPSSMEYDDLCNGCGLCCVIPADQNTPAEDCLYLKRLGNGLTLCKIHGQHTGTMLQRGYQCKDIMEVSALYDDCPYNELKINLILK